MHWFLIWGDLASGRRCNIPHIYKFSLVLATAKTLIALGFASLSSPLFAYRLTGGMGWGWRCLTTWWLFYIGCECDSLLNTGADECNAHIVACGYAFSWYLSAWWNWSISSRGTLGAVAFRWEVVWPTKVRDSDVAKLTYLTILYATVDFKLSPQTI